MRVDLVFVKWVLFVPPSQMVRNTFYAASIDFALGVNKYRRIIID